MVKKEIEAVGWIAYAITVVLILFVLWMLIQKLTGHSPTEITILLWAIGILATLQVLVITILFQIKGELGSTKEKMGGLLEFRRQTIEKLKEMEVKWKKN